MAWWRLNGLYKPPPSPRMSEATLFFEQPHPPGKDSIPKYFSIPLGQDMTALRGLIWKTRRLKKKIIEVTSDYIFLVITSHRKEFMRRNSWDSWNLRCEPRNFLLASVSSALPVELHLLPRAYPESEETSKWEKWSIIISDSFSYLNTMEMFPDVSVRVCVSVSVSLSLAGPLYLQGAYKAANFPPWSSLHVLSPVSAFSGTSETLSTSLPHWETKPSPPEEFLLQRAASASTLGLAFHTGTPPPGLPPLEHLCRY